MRTQLRAGAVTLALLGSIGFAAAQSTGGGEQQERLNLNSSQERSISQGLSGEQSQSALGYQGDRGSRPPESLQKKPLPSDVQAQVPQTKDYFFIKLPDRILLIDPERQLVAEIIAVPATTGGGSPQPAPGEPPR
jgi:hypothetical protein